MSTVYQSKNRFCTQRLRPTSFHSVTSNPFHSLRTKIVVLVLFLAAGLSSSAQRSIAISIDDVPNVRLGIASQGKSELLRLLDSARVPSTVFINEINVDKIIANGGDSNVLRSWITSPSVEPGLHTYSHPRLTSVGTRAFLEDVDRGAKRTRAIAQSVSKSVEWFRFPYNDCGADSLQQDTLVKELLERGFKVAPFSVESADYVFNMLYEARLDAGLVAEAAQIRERYIQFSIQELGYMDYVAESIGARAMSHIFLCHDNTLNRDAMSALLAAFRSKGYRFVSLTEALRDPHYKRPLAYHGKAGISWIYRWVASPAQRKAFQRAEPGIDDLMEEYRKLQRER